MQTNELVAHVVSESLKMPFVLETLEQMKALDFAPDALMSSDTGTHYTSRSYREKLKEPGLIQSMSRKANCWDNACIESWFGRMKEQIGSTKELGAKEIFTLIDNYIHYYRYHRGQKRLGWLTPCEYAESLAA